MTPEQVAAVLVDHRGNEIEGCGPDLFCIECDDVEWPCLPYRLAAHIIGHSDTEGRWLDVLRILEQP